MGLEVAPDGSWATYAENEPGSIGLVLRNLRDGSETRIPGQVFRATFSPGSRTVVYSVIGQNGWSLLAKALPDGEPRVITERTTGHLLGPLAWTEDGILAEEIIWASDAPPQGLVLVDPEDGTSSVIRGDNYLQARSTRDGAHIAFVTGVQMIGAPGEAGILVQDRATGTGQQIVPQHAGMISSLGWSPDASQLFYVPATFAENTIVVDDIHIITADGTNDRPLSIAEAEIQGIFRDAAWRDDDTLLVLTADAGGTVRLYEIAATDLTVAEIRSWESAITGLGDPIRFVRMPQP
jgi:hypothetical protein